MIIPPRKQKHKGRPREAERAQALVREQLKHGPVPEVAAIPARLLIAAADALGVRTQRGQWWLPS